MLAEEGARIAVGRVRGHDQKGQAHVRLPLTGVRGRELLHLADALRMVLEEALPRRQPDVVAALGYFDAEARALPSGEQQRGNLAARDHAQPTLAQRHRLRLGQVGEPLRLEGLHLFVGHRLGILEGGREQLRQALQVERAQLGQEGRAALGRWRWHQHVQLAGALEPSLHIAPHLRSVGGLSRGAATAGVGDHGAQPPGRWQRVAREQPVPLEEARQHVRVTRESDNRTPRGIPRGGREMTWHQVQRSIVDKHVQSSFDCTSNHIEHRTQDRTLLNDTHNNARMHALSILRLGMLHSDGGSEQRGTAEIR